MWIGISKVVGASEVLDLVRKHFPGLCCSDALDDASGSASTGNIPDVLVSVYSWAGEFPTLVIFDWIPESDKEFDFAAVAKVWALELACTTVVDGSEYGDDDSPFWSLVTDGDKLYLADDCDTAFGDNNPDKGPLKIIREIHQ